MSDEAVQAAAARAQEAGLLERVRLEAMRARLGRRGHELLPVLVDAWRAPGSSFGMKRVREDGVTPVPEGEAGNGGFVKGWLWSLSNGNYTVVFEDGRLHELQRDALRVPPWFLEP